MSKHEKLWDDINELWAAADEDNDRIEELRAVALATNTVLVEIGAIGKHILEQVKALDEVDLEEQLDLGEQLKELSDRIDALEARTPTIINIPSVPSVTTPPPYPYWQAPFITPWTSPSTSDPWPLGGTKIWCASVDTSSGEMPSNNMLFDDERF